MLARLLRSFALALCCIATVRAQTAQPLPTAVNTDPARAQVTLPEPVNPALPSLILIGDSTVRNGRDDGQGKGAAGQMIQCANLMFGIDETAGLATIGTYP